MDDLHIILEIIDSPKEANRVIEKKGMETSSYRKHGTVQYLISTQCEQRMGEKG